MQTLYLHLLPAGANTIEQHGIYRFAETACILMLGFAINDGEIETHDCTTNLALPEHFVLALKNPDILKAAHDANLIRALIQSVWQIDCPPKQWQCSAVIAQSLAIPSSLEACLIYLQLRSQIDPRGRKLLSRFCKPQTPSARQRKLWVGQDDYPAEWQAFQQYCKTLTGDIRALFKVLKPFDLSLAEWRMWHLDQRINDFGVTVDLPLVASAIKLAEQCSQQLMAELVALTGIRNPNSDAQIMKWLFDEHDEAVTALNKNTLPAILQRMSGDPRRVLEIRQSLRKISLHKLRAIQRSVSPDGRVRGLLQFLGAPRTGRWSGRVVQVQNLPKNHITDIGLAQQLVRQEDIDGLDLLYGNPKSVLSELVRTIFIASPGKHLIVSDFSAIEARVLAWGAGENWRLEVFRAHGKIYEASASQMFGVPVDRIVVGCPEYALRQKGKVAELALGYEGGVKALIAMGALDMGLNEAELPSIVSAWRRANPAITAFWRQLEREAMAAVKTQATVGRFSYTEDFLFMHLPSGRRLAYPKARIGEGRFGAVVEFWGKCPDSHQWGWQSTYGGKLTENWCQAVARDLLCEALFDVQAAGVGQILFTVHDEIVLEGKGAAAAVETLMSQDIPWAPGLPLQAKGFISHYYCKA